jgi:dipeptidyl aminopeptidase/acylaminoacyl peptidase
MTVLEFDERLKDRLSHAAPVVTPDPSALFRDVTRRRSRRTRLRRAGGAVLVVSVISATVVGFVVLDRAFRRDSSTVSAPTSRVNGPLVVSVLDSTEGGVSTTHLELVSADGSLARSLTPGGRGVDEYPDASPDGTRIAYVHYVADQSRLDSQLRVLNLVTGETVTLVSGQEILAPRWSPTGTEIAFLELRESNAIWSVPADGGEAHLLVEGKSDDLQGRLLSGSPSWSPDGTELAFEVSDVQQDGARSPSAIATLNLQTRALTILAQTNGNVGGHPIWSPDGTRIAYAGSEGIWMVSPTGGEPILVAPSREVSGPSYREIVQPRQPVWSPDGTMLAYVRTIRDRDSIWIDSLDGSEPTRIAAGTDADWLTQNDSVVLLSAPSSPCDENGGSAQATTDWLRMIMLRVGAPGGAALTNEQIVERDSALWLSVPEFENRVEVNVMASVPDAVNVDLAQLPRLAASDEYVLYGDPEGTSGFDQYVVAGDTTWVTFHMFPPDNAPSAVSMEDWFNGFVEASADLAPPQC